MLYSNATNYVVHALCSKVCSLYQMEAFHLFVATPINACFQGNMHVPLKYRTLYGFRDCTSKSIETITFSPDVYHSPVMSSIVISVWMLSGQFLQIQSHTLVTINAYRNATVQSDYNDLETGCCNSLLEVNFG